MGWREREDGVACEAFMLMAMEGYWGSEIESYGLRDFGEGKGQRAEEERFCAKEAFFYLFFIIEIRMNT